MTANSDEAAAGVRCGCQATRRRVGRIVRTTPCRPSARRARSGAGTSAVARALRAPHQRRDGEDDDAERRLHRRRAGSAQARPARRRWRPPSRRSASGIAEAQAREAARAAGRRRGERAGEREQQARAAHEIEMEREEAADDRHEQHAAADARRARRRCRARNWRRRARAARSTRRSPRWIRRVSACISRYANPMPKIAANLSLLFPQLPFLGALRGGGEGRIPLRRVPVSRIRSAARRKSPTARARRASRWCCTTCRRATPRRVTAASPASRSASSEFREGVERAIEYAKAVGCPRLNALAGIPPEGLAREKARANAGRKPALRGGQAARPRASRC